MERRRVDWANLHLSDGQPPVVDLRGSASPNSVLAAFHEMLESDDVDVMLRHVVEFARERIGLSRVAIYLRSRDEGVMCGTWGTDFAGNTIDEHGIAFGIDSGYAEFYARLAREGVYWSVVENAPLVVHLPEETRVLKRGWVCSTPIASGLEILGMMFNDAGTTGDTIDDTKQSQAAVLCSLVGTALDLARRRGRLPSTAPAVAARSNVVVKATRLLTNNPGMTADELGVKLRLSASRVARLFKVEMGMSLVDYRNHLRLERFSLLLDERGSNLLEAALAAGFGSYAQFHRVFSSERGLTPGKFLRSRVARQK